MSLGEIHRLVVELFNLTMVYEYDGDLVEILYLGTELIYFSCLVFCPLRGLQENDPLVNLF